MHQQEMKSDHWIVWAQCYGIYIYNIYNIRYFPDILSMQTCAEKVFLEGFKILSGDCWIIWVCVCVCVFACCLLSPERKICFRHDSRIFFCGRNIFEIQMTLCTWPLSPLDLHLIIIRRAVVNRCVHVCVRAHTTRLTWCVCHRPKTPFIFHCENVMHGTRLNSSTSTLLWSTSFRWHWRWHRVLDETRI